MKKFIINILFFSFQLVLIVLLFQGIASKNHKFYPSNMYYYKEFEAIYKKPSFDVIAIGNSKLLAALDKKTFETNSEQSIAVLGYSSSNISISKLTLETYLNKCASKPKFVLLEVSWFTFNNQRTHFHGIAGDLFIKDIRLWKNYFKFNTPIFPKIKKAFQNNLVNDKYYNSDLTYAERFKRSTPFTLDYKFKVSEMEKVFPDHIAGIDKLLLRDFNFIINLCNKEEINLILFSAPEDEVFSKFQKDIDKIKSIYSSISNSSSNIYYLDYTLGGDLYDKKFEKWLRNSHHINENALFTEALSKDIKERTIN